MPRPKPVTYRLPRSSTMCVAAVGRIPLVIARHVRPPSSLRTTPPLYVDGAALCQTFGRGRSCVPLIAAHTRPFTSGSKTIQYVVFPQFGGIPFRVALLQLLPPFPLMNRPISV